MQMYRTIKNTDRPVSNAGTTTCTPILVCTYFLTYKRKSKYSLRFKMFGTVNFLVHIWLFVLFKKNFVKYLKLYVHMKVYLTMNQIIWK